MDSLIREIENRGANVLCVFHLRFKDSLVGGRGVDAVIDHYFMAAGGPLIDVLISPVMFSLTIAAPEYRHLLERLDVPVLQAMSTGQDIDQWRAGEQGLTTVDITIGVAQPELDGVIIGVPVAAKQTTGIDPITGSAVNKYVPIPGRTAKMAELALNWARLRRLPNDRKKIAIVFHHYPPRNDRIGCAAGLDSFASVKALIDAMADAGYIVDTPYADGDELAKQLLGGLTADRRWMLPEKMAALAEASVDADVYAGWHASLPASVRAKMVEDWGAVPGELFVHANRIYFPGIINGHLFITIQPPRGYLEQIDKRYHDPHLSPPHQYLAHYRWMKEIFGADAVVHVGKHGSLEWLPGKAVGLGDTCYPDLVLLGLPNIYPYIINDPGEGTQAKRRANACIIDHLPPALSNAELYDELAEVESRVNDYQAARAQDPAKLPLLQSMIWEAVEKAQIDRDLSLSREAAMADFSGFMEKLHGYLSEIGDTAIADGLHTLGAPPSGDRLIETLAQLTRLANGPVPSLRDAVAAVMGFDPERLKRGRGRRAGEDTDLTGGQVIARAHALILSLLADLVKNTGIEAEIDALMIRHIGKTDAAVAQVLNYVRTDLLPRLMHTTDEMRACLNALSGRFVLPGPSGAPSRGQADILPTGRNFYSVDPQKIPTPAAWRVGQKLADALIARYREGHHTYPDSVGIVLWASPTMRSKGDDVAEILYLMGVRPVWQAGSGNVRGLEVIPLSELGRPRIDVTPRISGIFRDAFPLLIDLIDQGVKMAAALKEDPGSNFIRRHVLKDVAEGLREGLSAEAAEREATFRIFGAPPGSYGTGVSELIESKAWQTADDLGQMYIQWSSHAYGKNIFGRPARKSFHRALGRMSVTVKNEDTREKDMMACTDFYSHHGGLISAVRTVQGKLPFSLSGDSADPDDVKVRTTVEEARHIFRSRLLNPKWLKGLQRHGYKGAGDISKAMDIIIGWDATANVIDDWMYQRFADKVALNPDMQAWMKQVNPHALHNIIDKLLEAAARDLWSADPQTVDELRDAYLEIEGEIEEITD
ncbi:MAG: cobaltochelatase subunit CobN [Pseudomonadota bacterium]